MNNRAFTLIELLVVLSIISVVIGIGVYGILGVWENAEVQRTRVTVQQIMAAVTEYEAQTMQGISFAGTSSPAEESIRVLLAAVMTIPEAGAIIDSIEPEFLEDYPDPEPDGSNDFDADQINDSWGNPYQYRHYHAQGIRAHHGNVGVLPAHGDPNRPKPFVASAGPDGKFGDAQHANKKRQLQAVDNIYSFELP